MIRIVRFVGGDRRSAHSPPSSSLINGYYVAADVMLHITEFICSGLMRLITCFSGSLISSPLSKSQYVIHSHAVFLNEEVAREIQAKEQGPGIGIWSIVSMHAQSRYPRRDQTPLSLHRKLLHAGVDCPRPHRPLGYRKH